MLSWKIRKQDAMTCETEGTVKLTAAAKEKTPAMMTVAVVLKEEVGRRIGMVSDLICLGSFFGAMVRWFLSTK